MQWAGLMDSTDSWQLMKHPGVFRQLPTCDDGCACMSGAVYDENLLLQERGSRISTV